MGYCYFWIEICRTSEVLARGLVSRRCGASYFGLSCLRQGCAVCHQASSQPVCASPFASASCHHAAVLFAGKLNPADHYMAPSEELIGHVQQAKDP